MDFVGIDKFSLLDYEEMVSVVLFAPTCDFRCPFCHNGDSVLKADTSIPFEDIIAYLKSKKGLIDAVVVTGGEPTLMPDVIDKIRAIKELGFMVKLDTNGTNPDVVKKLLDEDLLNYIAMDIKNSEEKYGLTTGCKQVNIDNVKSTISLMINSKIDYEFRTTLVKEFHNIEDMDGIGSLIKGSKKLFLQKFVDREGVIQKGLHPIEEAEAESFINVLNKYVSKVTLRGY